jgi:hypothetical protein
MPCVAVAHYTSRCLEHAIHCACQTFIEAIAPTPIHVVKRALASVRVDEDDDNPDGPDTMMAELADGGDDDDDDTKFDPKDLLGKILAFVNQVHSSLQAHTYFWKLCVEEDVKPLQLLKWVRT